MAAALDSSAYVGKVVADPLSCLPGVMRGNAAALRNVRELVLKGQGIQLVRPHTFAAFPQLSTLWLDHNRLTAADIDHPRTLKRLYLDHNEIETIAPLSALRSLEHLDVRNNRVSRLDATLDVMEGMDQLRVLLLAGNPVSQEPSYRLRTLARLPWLTALDNHEVTREERTEAQRRFGATARGPALAQATALNHSLARTAKLVAAARAVDSLPGGAPNGGVPPGLGRGGSPFVHARPDVHFGGSFETSVAGDTRREVSRIHSKREEDAMAATRSAGVESAHRSGWGGELTDAGTGRIGTGLPGDERPQYVTSALINSAPPWAAEDVVTKATRLGMLCRGVEPELLRLDRMGQQQPQQQQQQVQEVHGNGNGRAHSVGARGKGRRGRRASLAERLAVGNSSIAILNDLAPVVGTRHASHPLDPSTLAGDVEGRAAPQHTPYPRQEGGGGATALHTARSLGGTHPKLAASLAAYSAKGRRMPEHAVVQRVLDTTGVRLTTLRGRDATLARFGVDASGHVSAASGSAPPDDGGLRFEGTPLPPHVPLLPGLRPSGYLGQWDKWKLAQIFKAADADGSGELTPDEIRACLSACADYGFCVDVGGEEGGGDAGGASGSTAMMGTAGGVAASALAMRRIASTLDSIFSAIDVDGSGTLTWREFLDAIESGQVEKREKGGGGGMGKGKPGTPTSTVTGRSPAAKTKPRPTSAGKAASSSASSTTSGATKKGGGGAPASSKAGGSGSPTKRPTSAGKHKGGPGTEAETVSVPQLRFRCVTGEEAAARGARYWKVAGESWARLQSFPHADPYREQNMARLHRDMVASSHKATRLDDIAKALGGAYDPRAPAPPPPQRTDWVRFSSLVPTAEEGKRGERGGRSYKVPYPGEEVDRDEQAVRSLLRPDVRTLAEEADDESGSLAAVRLATAEAVTRTVGDEKWERFRLKAKAREPHVVSKVKLYF